jgi:hypothetical protein
MSKKSRGKVTLLLLSPAIAELLTASSPPLEFFNPFTFIFLVGLYGTGVLIIREHVIKWRKGWSGVLLLGAAYGIVEEGVAVKSFFDPNWIDLGILGSYGRWLGVNWVWSVCLTVFHAVYSIAIPILLFGLIFPDLKNERLLSDRGLKVCFAIFFSVVVFINLFLTSYRPDITHYIMTLVFVVALVLAAKKVGDVSARNNTPLLSPKWFGFAGAACGFLFFFIMYAVPHLVPLPLIPILLEIALCVIVVQMLIKYSGQANNEYHKLAFAAGLLFPLIFLAFIHEISGVFGMSFVGIFFTGFLFYIRRRIRRYENLSIAAPRF